MATVLLSTTTVDIAIKYPLLYFAVYKNNRTPREDDEDRWAFLIGPSNETAESEGVRCGVELHLDSNGLRTWEYTQTIVPLWGEDDLITRIMIADIVNLGPLGETMRDNDLTPTAEPTEHMAGGSGWSSFHWVQKKLVSLERKPECFAYKCPDFGHVFEQTGRRLARVLRRAQEEREARGEPEGPLGVEQKTFPYVYGWKKPDDDETKIAVNLRLARGEPNTISRAVQMVTGVLGADSLEMRRQVAEKEQRESKVEQKREASAEPEEMENKSTLAERTKLQHVNEGKMIAQNVGGKEATAEPESAQVTASKLAVPSKATGEKNVVKDDDEDEEDTDEEKEAVVKSTTVVKLSEQNKPGHAPEGKKVAKVEVKEEDETESEDSEDEDEEGEEDEDEEDETGNEGNENDEEGEEEDDDDGDETEGVAQGNMAEDKVNTRSEGIRGTTVHLAEWTKSEKATGDENVAKDEDETESEEDEDEDEGADADEEQDDDTDDDEEDSDDDDEEEEEEEEDSEEEDDEDKGDEEGSEEGEGSGGAQTALKNIPTMTLSA